MIPPLLKKKKKKEIPEENFIPRAKAARIALLLSPQNLMEEEKPAGL